jgi:hypothetical protein
MEHTMAIPSGAVNGASISAPEVKGCTIKILPAHQWESAAARAVEYNPANAPMVQMLARDVTKPLSHPHLALLTSKYWGAAGVNLTVSFLDEPEAALRTRILSHMNAWGCSQTFSSMKSPLVVRSESPDFHHLQMMGIGPI